MLCARACVRTGETNRRLRSHFPAHTHAKLRLYTRVAVVIKYPRVLFFSLGTCARESHCVSTILQSPLLHMYERGAGRSLARLIVYIYRLIPVMHF